MDRATDLGQYEETPARVAIGSASQPSHGMTVTQPVACVLAWALQRNVFEICADFQQNFELLYSSPHVVSSSYLFT